MNEILLYVSILCTASMIPMILTHKCLKVHYLQVKGALRKNHNIFNTGLIWDALKEILISAIMPYSALRSKPG